jgi:hypothetical protein
MCTEKQDRQCAYNVPLRCIYKTIFAMERNKITYFCVCACEPRVCIIMERAKFMCHIIICGFSGPTGMILKKKLNKHKMSVLIFFTTFI